LDGGETSVSISAAYCTALHLATPALHSGQDSALLMEPNACYQFTTGCSLKKKEELKSMRMALIIGQVQFD
jgi:hypothetical protein